MSWIENIVLCSMLQHALGVRPIARRLRALWHRREKPPVPHLKDAEFQAMTEAELTEIARGMMARMDPDFPLGGFVFTIALIVAIFGAVFLVVTG